MMKNVPGWVIKDKFICLECIKDREVPKDSGYIPWKEAPKPGWVLKPIAECSRHEAKTLKMPSRKLKKRAA